MQCNSTGRVKKSDIVYFFTMSGNMEKVPTVKDLCVFDLITEIVQIFSWIDFNKMGGWRLNQQRNT